jgi:succinate dehydrogenase/fumarate reductase flavoprotein subunit
MTHIEELWAVVNDAAATRNERDAAKELIADIQCGRRLSIACMSTVSAYLRKQATQNRWGK